MGCICYAAYGDKPEEARLPSRELVEKLHKFAQEEGLNERI